MHVIWENACPDHLMRKTERELKDLMKKSDLKPRNLVFHNIWDFGDTIDDAPAVFVKGIEDDEDGDGIFQAKYVAPEDREWVLPVQEPVIRS